MMDAKELHYELRGGGRMWVEGASEDEEDTILRALSLLAAAEANDGTTPETDDPNNIDSWRATKDRSRRLERERNGLALAHADALEENARLKSEMESLEQALTDPENQPSQFGTVMLEWHEAELAKLRQLVAQQAEDDGLWFNAATAPEAYLQQELRKLHAAVEETK